ncbi:hypothetical protein [Saccharopolyspora cebuensis]|uniref:Uncharacterized protein n=1 Tax=Saccharopolyspora cebuensis TaxID=418759 RepID=A0ABV4CNQ7_9PSEU
MLRNDTAVGDGLVAEMDEVGLGPVASARVAEYSGVPVLEITLADSPVKARALARWAEQLTVLDGILGKHHRADPTSRFTLRGHCDGQMFVVIAVFDDTTEAAPVGLLGARIRSTPTTELVACLAELEEGSTP